MDKEELQKAVELLVDARERIAASKEEYLCCALSTARVVRGVAYYDSETYLQQWIEISLRGEATVGNWLLWWKGVPGRALSKRNMRVYRLAWIDHMIKALEK